MPFGAQAPYGGSEPARGIDSAGGTVPLDRPDLVGRPAPEGAHPDRPSQRPPNPHRLRTALVSTGAVVLVLVMLAAAALVTVQGRIAQLTAALDEAAGSAETLFDQLVSDPEAARGSLTQVGTALEQARGELEAFPMPLLGRLPGVRADMAAGTRALDTADSLVDEVAPTLIDVALLVDLSTGAPRDPGDSAGGWGQSADSAVNIIRNGADALDELCRAADDLEAIDRAPLREEVAGAIDRFAEAVRGACEQASEYETTLEALHRGGTLVDQLGELGREVRDRLDELGGRLGERADELPGMDDLPGLDDLPGVGDLIGMEDEPDLPAPRGARGQTG